MSSPNHQLLAIDLGDPPGPWTAAGFEVAEVDGCPSVLLDRTLLRLRGTGERMTGWALRGLDDPIDGLGVAELPTTDPTTVLGGSNPNGVGRIDHVVVSTDDVLRTVAAFEAAGLDVRGQRGTDSYGSPMRQTFFWAGDVIVELIGPDPDTTNEPDDIGTDLTAERGASFFGLALVAGDLDVTAERMGELLGVPKDAVQRGRRIAGLRGAKVGISVPIAVMSPHVGHVGSAGEPPK